jgi:hypothetical protein
MGEATIKVAIIQIDIPPSRASCPRAFGEVEGRRNLAVEVRLFMVHWSVQKKASKASMMGKS